MLWDPVLHTPAADLDEARVLVGLLAPRPGERILDVGAGDGRITERLAALVGAEGLVTGLDPSREMVAYARSRAGHRARYVVGALDELVAEAAFDAAYSQAVLHWVADLGEGFARLAKALRPGGRLVASFAAPGTLGAIAPLLEAVRAEPPYATAFPAGWAPPWHLRSEAELADRLTAAGFEAVRTEVVDRTATFDDAAALARGLAAAFARPHLTVLGGPAGEAYLAEVARRAFALGSGHQVPVPRCRVAAVRPG